MTPQLIYSSNMIRFRDYIHCLNYSDKKFTIYLIIYILIFKAFIIKIQEQIFLFLKSSFSYLLYFLTKKSLTLSFKFLNSIKKNYFVGIRLFTSNYLLLESFEEENNNYMLLTIIKTSNNIIQSILDFKHYQEARSLEVKEKSIMFERTAGCDRPRFEKQCCFQN
jgi:hypothetical protein